MTSLLVIVSIVELTTCSQEEPAKHEAMLSRLRALEAQWNIKLLSELD
jgi:hypothetical protein